MSFIVVLLVLLVALVTGAGESWLLTCRTALRRQVTSAPAADLSLFRADFRFDHGCVRVNDVHAYHAEDLREDSGH